MRTRIIYVLCALAAILTAAGATAQKYPERRMAREGNRLYERGDFPGAETRYRHALETNSELEEARFNLAGALFKQEKAEEAAKIWLDFAADSTATEKTLPRVAHANYNMGNVMLAGQKLDDAIEFYKQSLRIDPTDMQAKFNLAYAQKLKKEQENQDQNRNDQDQDNQDQNNDRDNNEGDQDQNQDQQDGEGDQDQNEGDQNEDNGDEQEQGGEPEPSPDGQPREVSISPDDARQMLEAIQDEEDKTREKMNAKEVPSVGRSGKNW